MLTRFRRLVAGRVTSGGSEAYWNRRYERGADSGAGSYGELATFKADVLNRFVADHDVASVIEFGCGDGNQLSLARYPRYHGFDVSDRAVALCAQRFQDDPTKTFGLVRDYAGERADLAMSLDVIYHLVEDPVFEQHMDLLFGAAERFAVVYSSNSSSRRRFQRGHVRHRQFSSWIADHQPDWSLLEHIEDPSRPAGDFDASFFFYRRA